MQKGTGALVKIKKPHLLVIGGTGFIGYNLLLSARKKGWKLSSLSLNYPKKYRYISDVNYISADITNLLELKKKLKGQYQYVVNSGGYGVLNSSNYENKKILNTHFIGVVNLVTIFEKKNILKFVQIGTGDEYGLAKAPQKENITDLPFSAYGLAKYYATEFLKLKYRIKKFPVTVLRFFLVFGPHQNKKKIISHAIINCLLDKKFKLTKGNQKRDYCYIENIIEAIFLALKAKKNDGEVINIGSGNPKTVKTLVKCINRLIGKGKPLFGAINYRNYENKNIYPDIKKANKKLKWKPKISVLKGLELTINYYKGILKINE